MQSRGVGEKKLFVGLNYCRNDAGTGEVWLQLRIIMTDAMCKERAGATYGWYGTLFTSQQIDHGSPKAMDATALFNSRV